MCAGMYSETMQAQKETLPWVIALVTLGAALGIAAAMYYDRTTRREQAGLDDSEAPLFI